MRCVTVTFAVLALIGAKPLLSQFLNNRPFPTYSLEHMPDTGFTCRDKVLGGYYADSETQCQMFHICVKVSGLGVQDFRFLCPNGTAFDQDSQICADWDDVDCGAATLYYSSDNFDLYRVGSGYETAAFAGEDEGTFHLQRSETGDARLNREHQSQRVNQQTDYNTAVPPKRPIPTHHRPQHQQQQQQQQQQQTQPPQQQSNNQDRDILRGSSSSNFFNNRNGGKESDDDYYNESGAPNQNSDIPKKKIVRKFNTRKPVEDNYEPQTQRPNRPTGFVNNFAGSVNPPSTTTVRTTPSEPQPSTRGRQNVRNRGGERHYNNAENFRNNNNNDGQYNNNNNNNRNQYTVSTPAPFRASNRNTNQYDNGQYNTPTTVAPKNNQQFENQRVQPSTTNAARQNQQFQTKQTENYPSTPVVTKTTNYNNQYQSNKQTENYPSTPVASKTTNYNNKQTDNYPSTPVVSNYNNQYQTKQQENYPLTPVVKKQTENYPSTTAPFKQQTTQVKKETENYPTTANFNKQSFNTQYDIPKKPTTFKQPETYSTTTSPPARQNIQKQSSQYYQPKETDSYPSTKQAQFDNSRNTQQFSTTNRPTTQHTQYTPTVPKQTTTYQYSSTTSNGVRFSKQFDETSYDDGSYSSRYDDDKYKPEDEFLKTAHSQNFASARNELLSSTKLSHPTTQSPRPFSVTTPLPRTTNAQRQTKPTVGQTVSKPEVKAEPPKKKTVKDVSYDYAYYDSNVGSEPEYDVGTEFQRSTKKSN